MHESAARFSSWLPRILAAGYALFLVLFALDVFEPGAPPASVALAFAIHLLPALLVLLVLGLAWRHELAGGAIFAALGLLYLALAWGRFPGSAYVAISGPLLLIGVLFLARGWAARRSALRRGGAPRP